MANLFDSTTITNFLRDLTRRAQLLDTKMDKALTALQLLLKKEDIMSKELEALQAQVQRTTDLEEGAITLIKGLGDQIRAAKDDPAKLQALADTLSTKADQMAAELLANTPAEPQASKEKAKQKK